MIQTNVITGSLGAGKTTIILNLIKQLPDDYKVIWLKNEYGDVNIDSEVAKLSNIQTEEVLNGCLCCVLVGKLHDALVEISEKYNPDRLIIETAGTAYPYPIVREINSVKSLHLDSLVTIIDAKNYEQFVDKTPMAKKQTQYVDLLVINKIGLVSEDELYHVKEDVNDLFYRIPQVESSDGFVNKNLLVGLDAKLAGVFVEELDELSDNVQQEHQHHHHHEAHTSHRDDVEAFSFAFTHGERFDIKKLNNMLASLNSKQYYRIKGIVNSDKAYLINYVVGDLQITELADYKGDSKITFMGKRIAANEDEVSEMLQSVLIANQRNTTDQSLWV